MFKRLPAALSQTILYGVSIALMKGVSLLMLPFIAHHLPAVAFGRLEVLSSLAVVGSILVGMGLEDTLYRFAGHAKDEEERRRHAASIFGLTLLIGAFAGLLGWFAAPRITEWMPGDATVYEVRLVLSVLALEGCLAIPLGWLRMRERAVAFFVATTGRALLQALLVLIFLINGGGVDGVLEAGLIAALAQGVFLGSLQARDTGIDLSLGWGRARGQGSGQPQGLPLQIFSYSLPIVGSGLLAFALTGLDRWVLAQQAGMVAVAQYGVAAKFALAAVLLLQPFGMWWHPRRIQVLNGVDGPAQAARFIALGLTLTLTITVLVGLASPLMITWLMPVEYAPAGLLAMGLVLAMAAKEGAELLNIGCFNGHSTRAQFLINLAGTLVGVAAMLILVRWWGVWGVVWAMVAAHATRLVLFFRVSQRLMPLPYPTPRLLILAAAGGVWLLVGLQVEGMGAQLALTSVAVGGMLALAVRLGLFPLPSVRFHPRVGVECS